MKKLWKVFRFEYGRRIKTRGFIFAVMSMPLIVVLATGMGFLSARMQINKLPIGFLDLSGILENVDLPEPKDGFLSSSIELIEYKEIESGKADVVSGKTQVFFVIPPNYLDSGSVQGYAIEKPGENAYTTIKKIIRTRLVKSLDVLFIERIESGSNITIHSLDGSKQANMRDWFIIFFPFASGLIFMIVINISGGYLLQSVVDEKENRTMEIIVTSVSPGQLMVGKIIGNLCVGLTQALIWFTTAILGLGVLEYIFDIGQPPNIQPIHLLLFFGIIFPGFILIAALMTIVGVTVSELREAQQVSLLFTLPMASPFWLAAAILQHPENPLTIFLSVFPFTSIVTMPLRISISTVPGNQILLAAAVTWISTFGALLLAAKAFRMGMLNYGNRIRLGNKFRKMEFE